MTFENIPGIGAEWEGGFSVTFRSEEMAIGTFEANRSLERDA